MSQDIRRVTPDGREFTLRYRSASTNYNPKAVTSAAVVAYLHDGRLALASLVDRGPDLPGGHIQSEDTSIEDAVRREAREEAGIHLGNLNLACVIESDFFGSDQLTYMLTFSANVTGFTDFDAAAGESRGRIELQEDRFVEQYSGDKGQMRILLDLARAAFQKKAGSE